MERVISTLSNAPLVVIRKQKSSSFKRGNQLTTESTLPCRPATRRAGRGQNAAPAAAKPSNTQQCRDSEDMFKAHISVETID
jgi:hypothetical protein